MSFKGLVLGLVLVLGLSAVSFAATPSAGIDLPASASPADIAQLVDGAWVSTSTGMAWNSIATPGNPLLGPSTDPIAVGGYCNKENWTFNFTNHASIAQWINWQISADRKDWRILKPGTYASDCISFKISSNNDVTISFSGFADLAYQAAPGGVKQTIDTWYGVGTDLANVAWVRAVDLDKLVLRLMDGQALHDSRTVKIYSKLNVVNCNSSSEYEDVGTVTIAVSNLKNWVDGSTGTYKSPQSGTLTGGYWQGPVTGQTQVVLQ